MPDGTMYMDIIVQKSSDKSAEGYVWGIALLRTNASGELLGTIYTCKTPETAAAPAPHDSCFEPIPRRVRPSGMQDMKYDACYRVCWFPEVSYKDVVSCARNAMGSGEVRWDIFLNYLVDATYIKRDQAAILEDALWLRPVDPKPKWLWMMKLFALYAPPPAEF